MKVCRVAFRDLNGIEHSCEVEAQSLYDAIAAAYERFHGTGCRPSQYAEMTVEARPAAVKHTVTAATLEKWLKARNTSEADKLRKFRVREAMSKLGIG